MLKNNYKAIPEIEMAARMSMPYKYRQPGVLLKMLQEAIFDNWDRCRESYTRVHEQLGHDTDRSIDKALLSKMRKDIIQDGPEFLDTQDGISSRLNSWLEEAFPRIL